MSCLFLLRLLFKHVSGVWLTHAYGHGAREQGGVPASRASSGRTEKPNRTGRTEPNRLISELAGTTTQHRPRQEPCTNRASAAGHGQSCSPSKQTERAFVGFARRSVSARCSPPHPLLWDCMTSRGCSPGVAKGKGRRLGHPWLLLFPARQIEQTTHMHQYFIVDVWSFH